MRRAALLAALLFTAAAAPAPDAMDVALIHFSSGVGDVSPAQAEAIYQDVLTLCPAFDDPPALCRQARTPANRATLIRWLGQTATDIRAMHVTWPDDADHNAARAEMVWLYVVKLERQTSP